MSRPIVGGRRGRFIASLCLLGLMCCLNTGCAAFAAARAPGKKDLSLLRPGTPRTLVVGELGPPSDTRTEHDGTQEDFYSFKQGYTKPTLATRSVFHTFMDIQTLFLWELVGGPMESSFQGEDVRAQVTYDERQQIQRVEYLAGAHLANGGATLAPSWRRKTTQQTAVLEATPRNGQVHRDSNVMPASQESSSP